MTFTLKDFVVSVVLIIMNNQLQKGFMLISSDSYVEN